MMDIRSPGIFFILFFILLAFPLSVVSLPTFLWWWRPEFLVLLSIYFALEVPEKFGVICAWLVGFFLDIVEGNVLGQTAIALSVVVYIVLLQYQRIRMFSLLQQMALIGMLVGIAQLLGYWIQMLAVQISDAPPSMRGMHFLQPAISSALCWPIIVIVLARIRRLLVTV
jgi:rod shape-determining protein MreD